MESPHSDTGFAVHLLRPKSTYKDILFKSLTCLVAAHGDEESKEEKLTLMEIRRVG